MSVLRDIFRRKIRSVLTISGIGVGVFALVVLGAVAENMNVYVDTALDYFADTVTVVEEEDANFVGMSSGNRPLSMSKVDELEAYPGVERAYPQVNLLLDGEYISVIPPLVLGATPAGANYDVFAMTNGRGIEPGDSGTVVLGSDLAKQLDAVMGDSIEIHGEEQEVVGMLERTYINLIDAAAIIPLQDAQQMYHASLPEAFQATVAPEDLVSQVTLAVEPGEDSDALAEALMRDVEGIHATGEREMIDTMDGLVGLLNTIIGSIAGLALLISGLSIVNTMMFAVSERTREIGVKRALGASRWRIARDILAESALMGVLGGLGGMLAGVAIALTLNSAMVATTGTTMMIVTGRLVLGSLVFALVLGTLGGLYPARHASRLEPSTALTYE